MLSKESATQILPVFGSIAGQYVCGSVEAGGWFGPLLSQRSFSAGHGEAVGTAEGVDRAVAAGPAEGAAVVEAAVTGAAVTAAAVPDGAAVDPEQPSRATAMIVAATMRPR